MLDLYFVENSCTVVPTDPNGLRYAGALDFEAHRVVTATLEQCRQSEIDFSYFDDSLLQPMQVVAMRRFLSADAAVLDADRGQVTVFTAILDRAASAGWGLAAFCD